MDRLFAFLVYLLVSVSLSLTFPSPAFARVENLGNLITEGYAEQVKSYQQTELHPKSLDILKTLAQTSPKDRKIKIRLIKKRMMIATIL